MAAAIVHLLLVPSLQAGISEGLLHYYPFDGNADDQSGNGNHGIANDIVYEPGVFSQAACFNGVSSAIDLTSPFDPIGRDYTIAVWIKVIDKNIQSSYQGSYIMNTTGETPGQTDPYYNALILNFDGNTERYAGYHNSEEAVVRATPGGLDGQWYHVTLTHDDDQMKNEIYINGEFASDMYISASGISEPVDQARLGTDRVGEYLLHGLLDDLRIYDRVLSVDEIEELVIPEPVTFSLLTLGSLALLRRRNACPRNASR